MAIVEYGSLTLGALGAKCSEAKEGNLGRKSFQGGFPIHLRLKNSAAQRVMC
jgi:hypothetical protein